jgi:hypothetical protein
MRPRLDLRANEHSRPPQDNGERGAELVRDGREELVLQAVGSLRFVEQPLALLGMRTLFGDVAEGARHQIGGNAAAASRQQPQPAVPPGHPALPVGEIGGRRVAGE